MASFVVVDKTMSLAKFNGVEGKVEGQKFLKLGECIEVTYELLDGPNNLSRFGIEIHRRQYEGKEKTATHVKVKSQRLISSIHPSIPFRPKFDSHSHRIPICHGNHLNPTHYPSQPMLTRMKSSLLSKQLVRQAVKTALVLFLVLMIIICNSALAVLLRVLSVLFGVVEDVASASTADVLAMT